MARTLTLTALLVAGREDPGFSGAASLYKGGEAAFRRVRDFLYEIYECERAEVHS